MTDLDAIIAKIQKLKALADHPSASRGEAENAAAKIQALMLEHNLEETHLAIAAGTDLTGYTYEATRIPGDRWRAYLLSTLAKGHNCMALRSRMQGMLIFGHRDTIPVVLDLYRELSYLMETLSARAYDPDTTSEHKRTWRNSWCYGAVDGLGQRYAAQLEAARRASEANSTALVVISDKIKETLNTAFPDSKVRKAAPIKADINTRAYYAGRAAAQDMALDRQSHLA